MKKIALDTKYTFLGMGGISAFFTPIFQRYIDEALENQIVLLVDEDKNINLQNFSSKQDLIKLPMANKFSRLFFPFRLRNIWKRKLCLFSPYYDILVPPVIPYAVVIHDLAFFSSQIEYKFKVRCYFFLLLCYHVIFAKKIVMISQTERKKMLQIFPWLSKKIMIINNFHPWDFNSIESNNYDMHIGSSEDAFKSSLRLIYTGGGERRKNIDLLLRAITLLQPKFSKLELWVTGDRSAFMATASADLLSLVDARVTYLGSLSDIELRHAYQRADVVVYPSLYEGYGRVVADAIVMKKPIVTLRLAVFQEFFGNYPVYADNNADSFAEAVESAKKNGLNRNSPKLVSAEESYTQFKKVVDSLC